MKRIYTDQMGKTLHLPFTPKRIISLVPSQTELLFDLGLEEEIVGITKFCIHPKDQIKKKVKVGGTKQLKMEVIRALQPDLIIGNKEENEKTQIEQLSKNYPVWMSDITNLETALNMILQLGIITNREKEATNLNQKIKRQFQKLNRQLPPLRAAYFIWRKPYMTVGKGTFIHEMIQYAGFTNVFGDQERYPEITLQQLTTFQPEIILLSSEPFPFKEKHKAEFKQFCPKAVIKLVNGELFSWYGSRLLQSASYFLNLLKELSKINPAPKTPEL